MKKFIFFVMFLLSTSFALADPIVTDSTSNSSVTTKGESTTTVKSPPPSAISPSINNSNSDVCTIAFSGAVQTQILGISGGSAMRDMNCERMKLSKLLNDYGMKVAAVAILCQDPRVFEAMEQAGTPCPFEGKIGGAAVKQWKKYDIERPDYDRYVEKMDDRLKIDERIAKDEGTLAENESLKTNIKEVGKENTQLQKDIAELKKAQAELIAAQEAEIKRLEAIVALEEEEARLLREEAEAQREMEEAEAWANAELDRLEALANGEILVEELPPVEATDEVLVEETEDGRVKLTIPVTPGR